MKYRIEKDTLGEVEVPVEGGEYVTAAKIGRAVMDADVRAVQGDRPQIQQRVRRDSDGTGDPASVQQGMSASAGYRWKGKDE